MHKSDWASAGLLLVITIGFMILVAIETTKTRACKTVQVGGAIPLASVCQ